MAATELQTILGLLSTPELPELGPGPRPGIQPVAFLNQNLQAAFAKSKLPAGHQQLIKALVLLWHDHQDAAHVIAQEVETMDGSFIHGIVHRREPDYGNAKYWFRRVGEHPAFPGISGRATALFEGSALTSVQRHVVRNGQWDALGFVDACEQGAGKGSSDPQTLLLRQLQKIESEVLLEYLCL
jgi:hypothetical protein